MTETTILNSSFLLHPFKLGFSSRNNGHIVNSITLNPICNTKLASVCFDSPDKFSICKKCIKLHSLMCANERNI